MRTLFATVLAVFFVVFLYRSFVAAPSGFPVPYDLTITSGESLGDITRQLSGDHVIRSSELFKLFMIAFGGDKHISEGEYYFDTPLSSLSIAMRISGRQFGIEKEKITFPEGFTNTEMAKHLGAVINGFNTTQFLTLAKTSQGYLFPDTYGFFPNVTPDAVIATMKQNYQRKITPLKGDIVASGHSESDIVIMASLIEKEASGPDDRATIAGILWKRIDIGIALQIDAFPSTYTTKGLPSAPIDNPGLAAIEAALHPTSSPYLYYLHDKNGAIHYASTYAEHERNINKYLK